MAKQKPKSWSMDYLKKRIAKVRKRSAADPAWKKKFGDAVEKRHKEVTTPRHKKLMADIEAGRGKPGRENRMDMINKQKKNK